ncbi:hypothetical protein D3C73_1609930 [compost metagenome]
MSVAAPADFWALFVIGVPPSLFQGLPDLGVERMEMRLLLQLTYSARARQIDLQVGHDTARARAHHDHAV